MSFKTISLASLTIEDNRDVSGETSGWIFFWILMQALLTSSLVVFFLISRFKILYASETVIDDELLEFDLLKENLPDLLKVWISLNNEISWRIDRPFNFNNAKLASVKGSVSKNLPPIANNMANKNKVIINRILTLLEIFFEETVVNFFNNK